MLKVTQTFAQVNGVNIILFKALDFNSGLLQLFYSLYTQTVLYSFVCCDNNLSVKENTSLHRVVSRIEDFYILSLCKV